MQSFTYCRYRYKPAGLGILLETPQQPVNSHGAAQVPEGWGADLAEKAREFQSDLKHPRLTSSSETL